MDVAPALSVVTQAYGCTDFPEYVCCGCSLYFHYGIDLSSWDASDKPQRATRPGTVYAAGPGVAPGQPGLGTAVIINMDDGYDMLYGHLWSAAVSAGQRVAPGDVIGYTGSTGYSTGPHAHIEVRQRGNLNASPNGLADPWPWLNFGAAIEEEDMTDEQAQQLAQVAGAVGTINAIHALISETQGVGGGPPCFVRNDKFQTIRVEPDGRVVLYYYEGGWQTIVIAEGAQPGTQVSLHEGYAGQLHFAAEHRDGGLIQIVYDGSWRADHVPAPHR